MKLRISATDRIVLKLSKLEFKWTRRKKIDFGNELTVLNESSSSRVFVILTNWSFGPQKIMIWYLNLRVKVATGQQRVRIIIHQSIPAVPMSPPPRALAFLKKNGQIPRGGDT